MGDRTWDDARLQHIRKKWRHQVPKAPKDRFILAVAVPSQTKLNYPCKLFARDGFGFVKPGGFQ